MEKEALTIVVCGEVDHGKSTFLGRLLCDTRSLPDGKWAELTRVCRQMGKGIEPAYLLDQFKEEREEERTIDTTQAFFKTRKRRYCLIDTPGHLEFIKNMMTGATQADAAVLIVDATSGVGEQTKRHARLLKMLGIDSFIVAVNKMDLVKFRQKSFEAARKKALSFLKQIGLEPVVTIPIAAKEGHNISRLSVEMKWYRGPDMAKALDSLCCGAPAYCAPFRFPIQDAYKMGAENICVGRVESGYVKAGQKVVVFPCGRETVISAIKVFGKKKACACAGENIGLVLSGYDGKRGDVICSTIKRPRLYKCFEGNIFWFAQKPLKVGDALTLRCATQEAKCVITRIYKREVKKNELARVVFKTKTPIVIENFEGKGSLGRFILEDGSGVCGFGIKL